MNKVLINSMILFGCFGIVFLIAGIVSPTFKKSQIRKDPISGRVESFKYKFVNGGRVAASGSTYIIKLNNYSSNFVIQDENYFSFKREFFEKTVRKGDTLNLIVLDTFLDSKNKPCALFEVSKGKTKYLTLDDSISSFENSRNTLLVGGGGGLLIFFILLIIKERKKISFDS